jgi:general stress protein 26
MSTHIAQNLHFKQKKQNTHIYTQTNKQTKKTQELGDHKTTHVIGQVPNKERKRYWVMSFSI